MPGTLRGAGSARGALEVPPRRVAWYGSSRPMNVARSFPPTRSFPPSKALTAPQWAVVLLGLVLVLVAPGCDRTRRPNVLVVTIDTLRADRVGCYGFGLAYTPTIDRLARDGVRCTDAVSAAPITLPAHSSIMTGLYPPAHGVRDNGNYALGPDAVTLAERLEAAGYDAGAFVSAAVLPRRSGPEPGLEAGDADVRSADEPDVV